MFKKFYFTYGEGGYILQVYVELKNAWEITLKSWQSGGELFHFKTDKLWLEYASMIEVWFNIGDSKLMIREDVIEFYEDKDKPGHNPFFIKTIEDVEFLIQKLNHAKSFI